MPSASANQDYRGPDDALEPLQKVLMVMETKTRCLELRKNKLDYYRTCVESGKALTLEQQESLSDYDSIITSLDLMKELSQECVSYIPNNIKVSKRQLKRDLKEKYRGEIDRVKEILKLLEILQLLNQDNARSEFSTGTNGAVELSAESFKYIDKLQEIVCPIREKTQSIMEFEDTLRQAATHIVHLLEGRKLAIVGTTYKVLHDLMDQIGSCQYPENKIVPDVEQEEKEEEETKERIVTEEYTNGMAGEESDVVTPTNEEVVKKTAPEGPPPGLTLPTVTSPPLPPVTQEHNQVSPVQEALVAVMAQMTTATVTGAPPAASELPPAPPSYFTQPAPPMPQQPPQPVAQLPHQMPQQVTQPMPPQVPQPVHQQVHPQVPQHIQQQPPPQQPIPQHPPTQHPPPPQPLPQQSPPQPAPVPMQPPAPPQLQPISLSDLVSPGIFDFLQESQVSQEPTVYMDPAVVSIGSVKPDPQRTVSPVQQLQPPPPIVAHTQDIAHPSNIPTQTYTNQTFNNIGVPPPYTQSLPMYANNTVVDSTPNVPPPIPLPPQPCTQGKGVEFNPEASPWTESQQSQQQPPPPPPQQQQQQPQQPQQPPQQQTPDNNWIQEVPVNGDDKWANAETGTWEEFDENQGNQPQGSMNGPQDYDRRSGYRGRGRGFGTRGNFRGGRGGNGNGYQNGRGGYGGGYGGYRGGRGGMGGMGGPRGRSGFRGQGPRGGFRGRGGGGYQGQRPYQQQHQQQ